MRTFIGLVVLATWPLLTWTATQAAAAEAEARYVITNVGIDVTDSGHVLLVPAGHHDAPNVASGHSGDTVRLPDGTYDVHLLFSDGFAHKDLWIDHETISGKLEKTVEMALPIAELRVVITNGGADVTDSGHVQYFPAGHRDGGNVASGHSGDAVRIPAGAYDVEIWFSQGMINKHIWLANQNLAGKLERTVELGLHAAEPTVAVTQNGAEVGDKAGVAYIDPATHAELGQVRSGETALLEAGTYDIHASLFGAEGWLRHVALSGKPRLAIEIKPLQTEQLRLGGPPPVACAIEVYGVNFDFDKATLRPDSEPMLKQILALFTHTPGFSAEIGGHTDNVGTPEYNLKLSDARAASVKAWLQAHGVAPARVASRGYGDTRPLLSNTTDENRFKNRRVELRTANCR